MSIATTSKINRLLADAVPGGLLFAAWLRKEGYSAQLIKRYRDSGWLEGCRVGLCIERMIVFLRWLPFIATDR